MCNRNRRPVCGDGNIPVSSTPGVTGFQDASDPNKRVIIPHQRGVIGANENSENVIKNIIQKKLGTCEFYEILSQLTTGDKESGYYWNYGRKYCKRFNNSKLAKDPKASRWIDCVTINLQREIINKCLSLGDNLGKIKEVAYASHSRVYTDCGICELDKSFHKQLLVILTPDPGDLFTRLGFKQVKEAIRNCFFRPFLFEALIDRHESWGDLNEKKLANRLVNLAKADSEKNYKLILGVMEMLSNTCDDDDVAMNFIKMLSDKELEFLSRKPDGRRILYIMKSALKSGVVCEDEKFQINRIGDKSKR